jgi:hypothetical protein
MGFLKQAGLRWSPAFRQQIFCWSSRSAIQVREYFPDHNRIFSTIAPALFSTIAPALFSTIAPALFYLRPSMGSYLLHPCSRAPAAYRSS